TQPAAEFAAWFAGPNNSLAGQIARRKLLPGGRLKQQVVRQALAELGWQAYRYAADCIQTVMNAVENSIPEPLTDSERACFEQTYYNQTTLGNLPLVLLYERFPFIKEIIWDFLHHPGDQQVVCILYRLLVWYSDMAKNRRHADKRIKERRPANRSEGERTPLTVSFQEGAIAAESHEAENPSEAASKEPFSLDSSGASELLSDVADLV